MGTEMAIATASRPIQLVLLLLPITNARLASPAPSPKSVLQEQAPKPAEEQAPPKRAPRLSSRDASFRNAAIAGGAAACAATVAFHPVDTMKTILQQAGCGGCKPCGPTSIFWQLGPKGLYRGVLPAAFSMMPACAMRMGAYETLKGFFLQGPLHNKLSPGALVFLASAMSVVASSSVRAPLDMIKTKVQADTSVTALKAMRTAWSGGLPSIYRGVGLGLMRDVPFFGCNLVIYEQLKAAARESKYRRCVVQGGGGGKCKATAELTPLELVLIGAAAQGIAGFVTNPADVLKTRVQSGAYAGMAAALAACGPGCLMRGATMRVAWIAPQGCVYYPVYEAVQSWLAR